MFSFKSLQALGDVIIYISVEPVTVLNFETAARKKAVDREKEMMYNQFRH